MAEFIHHVATTTAPGEGWLSILSGPVSRWQEISLSSEQWIVRGTVGSGYFGWTITVSSAGGFTPGSGGYPAGVVGGIDVRAPDGSLVATVRGLAPLNHSASTFQGGGLNFFRGDDTFVGSDGDDHFTSGAGRDVLSGGLGNDTLTAQIGTINGGAGNDTLQLDSGTVSGGEGNDTVQLDAGTVSGGDGNDTLHLGQGDVDGGSGNDFISLDSGVADGGSGADTLTDPSSGGSVKMTNIEYASGYVIGGSASGIIGSSQADTLTGGIGSDVIAPGPGNDVVDAGASYTSTSWLALGLVTTTFTISNAIDTLDFSALDRPVRIDLSLQGPQDTGAGIKTLSGFEAVRGSPFNDVLVGPSIGFGVGSRLVPDQRDGGFRSVQTVVTFSASASIFGGAGNDTIVGGPARDGLSGEQGDDLLVGGAGNDNFDGGSGFDVVDYTRAPTEGVRAILGSPLQTLFNGDGEGGTDSLFNIEGLIGTRFADTLTASADFAQGAFLKGGEGGDVIAGGAFGDNLQGAEQNDTVSGGGGGDKFVLALDGSVDRITDFSSGQGDRILLFDAQGAVVNGAGGVLILDAASGGLSWDGDGGNPGTAPAIRVGTLDNVTSLARANLDPAFAPTAIRVLQAGGAYNQQVFDRGNQAFDYTRTQFAADGRAETYETWFDDGSASMWWWDLPGDKTWASQVADYDRAGALTSYTVVHDSGVRTYWQFDMADRADWLRALEEHDSAGRLSRLAIAWDDDTSWDRFIDAADAHPWAYYVENYAFGSFVNRVYYNGDGSIFT